MKRLLLINPKFPESFWSFSWALENVVRDKKAVNSPLGLATLAALTPPDWTVTIVDENVQPIDWSVEVDVVGVCGMGVQAPRQKEILRHFKDKGIYVVAGGSYASLCPEEYQDTADSVISGEAEYLWPRFCADFAAGRPERLYRETGEVDLRDSPAPRYDLLPLHLYQKVSLQFSRGCPYLCEFCDIIVMFGRKPRTKSVEQIGRELDLLRGRHVTSVFFVDDNLIGHLASAKELLSFLIEYQERHRYRFSFGTEASINMAADPELMDLFRRANFEWVFIGIETPSREGLKETRKNQNLRGDLLTSIRTIYSHGIDILAGFIVGFDADDETIFERQYNFIVSSGITVSMVALLTALPKTPLYKRLEGAGRLIGRAFTDNTRLATNVIPLRMTYDQLVAGYQRLNLRLTEEGTIFRRIANKLCYLKNPVHSPQLSLGQKAACLWRLMTRGILPGGLKRVYYFVRSLGAAIRCPGTFAAVITDWAAALSLKAYQSRHFERVLQASPGPLNARLTERFHQMVERGIVLRAVALQEGQRVWIDLKESLDLRVTKTLSQAIRWTLKKTHEGVVIDCRFLTELDHLPLLLRRLRRYHHRVHIQITEAVYQKLRQELSPFAYTLVPECLA